MVNKIVDPNSSTAQRAVELAVSGKEAFDMKGGLNMDTDNQELAAAGFAPVEEEVAVVNTPTPVPTPEPAPELSATAEIPAKDEGEEKPVPGVDVEFSTDPAIRLDEMVEFFKKMLPDAVLPPKEALAQWKAIHGDVFFVPMNGKLYIYRYIKRQEWNQLQVDPAWQNGDANQRKDTIYNKCLLWPQLMPHEAAAEPAGIQDTLVTQIEQQSGWLDAYDLASTTFKL